MRCYETTIDVAAAPANVWQVLSNVVAWPQWLPTVVSVRALDAAALAEGNRYEIRQPQLREATWVVTKLEPPRRFVWQSRSPGLTMIADHIVDPGALNHAHVTLRFEFSGLLGAPVATMYRSLAHIYLAQEAAALRRKVEGPGRNGAERAR